MDKRPWELRKEEENHLNQTIILRFYLVFGGVYASSANPPWGEIKPFFRVWLDPGRSPNMPALFPGCGNGGFTGYPSIPMISDLNVWEFAVPQTEQTRITVASDEHLDEFLDWRWVRAIFQDVRYEKWREVFDGCQYGVWARLINLFLYYFIPILLYPISSILLLLYPPGPSFILFILFLLLFHPMVGLVVILSCEVGIFDASIDPPNRVSWQTLASPASKQTVCPFEIIVGWNLCGLKIYSIQLYIHKYTYLQLLICSTSSTNSYMIVFHDHY